ncbi:MAG TPA: hypothetical protein VFV99_12935 [Kofleriaceae bacterium]|nr:hypothetical protein [Kofleriaceae bacterium]
MKQYVVLAVAIALCVVACRGGGTKTKRTGSAAPVQVIDEPQLLDAGHGPGPNADEIEPNDGDEVATPMSIGGTARGKIDPETDVDYYHLTIDKPGVLQVTLSPVEGMDLSLELADASATTIAKSDRGAARVKEGLPNVGVTPGRYTLIVKQVKKKPAKPAKPAKGRKAPEQEPPSAPVAVPVYELSTQMIDPGKGGEHEPDDDRGTANDLIVADNATGFIGWSGDRDVWKLSVETLSDKNLLDVHVSAIEGIALELEISDGIGQPLATRKAPKGAALEMKGLMPNVPQGAPPFHYLTVRADKSNPETAYTLHATARIGGTDEEVEPNDLVDKPYMMPTDRTVVHATWSPGDIDCFGLSPAGTARQIDVNVDTPGEINLDAELLVDGKSVAIANKGGKGVAEKLTAIVPANTRPVVRIKNPDANATVEAKYDVTIQESTATQDNAP